MVKLIEILWLTLQIISIGSLWTNYGILVKLSSDIFKCLDIVGTYNLFFKDRMHIVSVQQRLNMVYEIILLFNKKKKIIEINVIT